MKSWAILAVVFVLITIPLTAAGAPSPHLFAGVAAGAVCALGRPSAQLTMSAFARGLALGIIGVQAGSMIDKTVVATIVDKPLITVGAAVSTLAITMLCGQLLRFSRHISASTATFSSIAGGASGLTAMARELDADETVVVSVQYLRVLVVVLSVPVVAPFLGKVGSAHLEDSPGPWWSGLIFAVGSLAIGLTLARWLTFTASKLVLPMLIAMAIAITGVLPSHEVPTPIFAAGIGVIGLMVGLDLTRSVLRKLASIMPLAAVSLGLGLAGCAGIGLIVSKTIEVNVFTGYLATTPGGLPAVTAMAADSGADVGLVVTCQALRLFLALALGVVVAGMIKRRGET